MGINLPSTITLLYIFQIPIGQIQLSDFLSNDDYRTDVVRTVNDRDESDWIEKNMDSDNGDLKIDLSLDQLVGLVRKIKNQNKIDRQQRTKKQICYVQELC